MSISAIYRDSYAGISPIISSKLLTSHSAEDAEKETLAINKHKIMKPPPPPNNNESLERRRSTSLSPSLAHNKSPGSLVRFSPIAHNIKERQVVFNDNVISHSPPLSPCSDDNAPIVEGNCILQETLDESKTFEERESFSKLLEPNEKGMLHQNILKSSQTSNGHRVKFSMSSTHRNISSPKGQSCSTTIAHQEGEETGGAEMCISNLSTNANYSPSSNTLLSSSLEDGGVKRNIMETEMATKFSNPHSTRVAAPPKKDTNIIFSKNNLTREHNNPSKDRMGILDNEGPQQRENKQLAQRYSSQNKSPIAHQMIKEDPYNYVIESPKEPSSQHTDTRIKGCRKEDDFEEDSDQSEGIEDNVKKRNMVRPT